MENFKVLQEKREKDNFKLLFVLVAFFVTSSMVFSVVMAITTQLDKKYKAGMVQAYKDIHAGTPQYFLTTNVGGTVSWEPKKQGNYEICNHRKMGSEVPIIFPDFILHTTFAHMNPIHAGNLEIGIDPDEGIFYEVSGGSISLGLKSRPVDAEIIKHTFEFEA